MRTGVASRFKRTAPEHPNAAKERRSCGPDLRPAQVPSPHRGVLRGLSGDCRAARARAERARPGRAGRGHPRASVDDEGFTLVARGPLHAVSIVGGQGHGLFVGGGEGRDDARPVSRSGAVVPPRGHASHQHKAKLLCGDRRASRGARGALERVRGTGGALRAVRAGASTEGSRRAGALGRGPHQRARARPELPGRGRRRAGPGRLRGLGPDVAPRVRADGVGADVARAGAEPDGLVPRAGGRGAG
mmetsp:Transcript_3291/g.9944  ORF Transcript_3291/g.9944 Transcript_3291/m.9944 type:complete len:246 (-) Transcript_3291:976-1713(-)